MRTQHRATPKTTKRLPPKKRKVSEWCPGAGKLLPRALPLEYDDPETGEPRTSNGREYEPDFRVKGGRKVRCPTCNRRLTPRISYCIGGEYINQVFPRHKAK